MRKLLNLNPKDWLLAALGVAVAVLGALALLFRGNAAAAKERLKDRNLKAAQAQRDAVELAATALHESQKNRQAEIDKKVKDAKDSKHNPFNDSW